MTKSFDGTRRGGNDFNLSREDLQLLLEDFLSLSPVGGNQLQISHQDHDLKFENNEAFWTSTRELYEGAHVLLEDFSVMEWAPLSPGRFHTEAARRSRSEAIRNFGNSEYLPLGKMQMVLGGVGSVRLTSEKQNGKNFHMLGATSNGDSHEGIPIRISRPDYRELMPKIKEFGCCDCTLLVELEHYSSDGVFDAPTGVPRYLLNVKDIDVLRSKSDREPLVTVSVMFLGANRGNMSEHLASKQVGWSYASFDPSDETPTFSLDSVVGWLKDYCSRHSIYEEPHIISDFDAVSQHFPETVMLSLEDLLANKIDLALLGQITRKFGLTINIEQLGDRFENVKNSRIVNRSLVS